MFYSHWEKKNPFGLAGWCEMNLWPQKKKKSIKSSSFSSLLPLPGPFCSPPPTIKDVLEQPFQETFPQQNAASFIIFKATFLLRWLGRLCLQIWQDMASWEFALTNRGSADTTECFNQRCSKRDKISCCPASSSPGENQWCCAVLLPSLPPESKFSLAVSTELKKPCWVTAANIMSDGYSSWPMLWWNVAHFQQNKEA